jgi:aldose 1-epimerase
LYDAEFILEHSEVNDNHASVSLVYQYHKQDTGFPFEYEVKLNWVFEENNKVSVTTTILNNSAESFPMMDGWHPYFKLGESINDCTIWFSDVGLLAYDLELIPTGKIIPNNTFANGQSLLNITLDNGYVLNPQNLNCILENSNYKLVVTPNSNYGYLQLYTPPHRKSIAIENLSAAPDCFNNKMGLHMMQPQETWSLKTQYQLFYK